VVGSRPAVAREMAVEELAGPQLQGLRLGPVGRGLMTAIAHRCDGTGPRRVTAGVRGSSLRA